MNVDHKRRSLISLLRRLNWRDNEFEVNVEANHSQVGGAWERDTELLTKLYQKVVINIDSNSVNRDYNE